jgi:hypothetical protein
MGEREHKQGSGQDLITVDAKALEAIIEAKVAARLAEERANAPHAPVGRHGESLRPIPTFEERVQEVRGEPTPAAPQRLIPCRSEITGSTFTARVAKSRTSPEGRIVGLDGYTHPAGADKYISDGGDVPDGFPIFDANGKLTPLFKQWKWETYWQRDLRDFVGKPFQRRFAVDPNAAHPWHTPERPKDDAEAAE